MKADPSAATRPQDDTLLRELAAQPRPTGSGAIASARTRCVRELRELGFEIKERPFDYSALPGRFATPLFGAIAALMVGIAGTWALEGRRIAPAVLLTASVAALAVAARWLTRTGVLRVPLLRAQGVNLEAALPNDAPAVWLCAHVDSKSQPIPSLLRVAGVIVESLGILVALAAALAAASGVRVHELYWAFAGVVTLAGAVPVGLSMVGTVSPGALDNASGVTTVIAAARGLQRRRGVGVLITDAEELGLAGARAWGEGTRSVTVLNCDGVDDRGAFTVMTHGSCPEPLRVAVAGASRETGTTVEFTRMLPGLLTDSVAFADAGHASVTFGRGTLGSLARVHSTRDSMHNLRGDGIAPMAALLAATARRLT